MPGCQIVRERATDAGGVRQVNERAFGQPAEADVVDALRAAGAVTLSLVALVDERVVGHILFSPVVVIAPGGSEWAALGLGPMAVAPEHQRAGIGAALIRGGLDQLRSEGHDVVVVVGHPGYYPRFGFVPASARGLRWEHEVPDDVFMVCELAPGALAGRSGEVRYRPEFSLV